MSQCVGILGFKRPLGLGPLVHPLEQKPSVHLLWFQDPECEPCKAMAPIVKQLESEENISVIRLSKKQNKDLINRYSITSIPAFVNPDTGAKLEGKITKEQLKSLL